MIVDFSKGQITLVVAPIDMRCGYQRLAALANIALNIDVDAGGRFLVFSSRRSTIAKIIWRDKKGTYELRRRLDRGAFERFLVKASDPAYKSFTVQDLEKFLVGEPVYVRKESVLQ